MFLEKIWSRLSLSDVKQKEYNTLPDNKSNISLRHVVYTNVFSLKVLFYDKSLFNKKPLPLPLHINLSKWWELKYDQRN